MKTKSISDLTVEQVDEKLLELMNEQPDFIYNNTGKNQVCHYNKGIDNDESIKGCIFGQAFQRCGVPIDSEDLNSFHPICSLWETYTNNSSPIYWNDIQYQQDMGSKWGDLKKFLKQNEQ